MAGRVSRSAVRIQWHLQYMCCHWGMTAAPWALAEVTAADWNIVFPAPCKDLLNEGYASENIDENIATNKSIQGLVIRYCFFVTGHVETVCSERWDKNENGRQDKNFRGVACLALAVVAVLIMLWYAKDTLLGSYTSENLMLSFSMPNPCITGEALNVQ